MSIKEIISNPKIAATISTATASTGMGQYLDMIPTSDLVKISTIVGITLSVVLIVSHIVKLRADRRQRKLVDEKTQLEIEMLKTEKADRLEDSKRMNRRKDDRKD